MLFPPICQGCGARGRWLCDYCLASVEFWPNPVPLKLPKTNLKAAFAATYFLPPISTLIKAYKYKPYPDLGDWLGEWLFEVVSLPPITCITWVPLHPTKLKTRGFNQTKKIAKALAKKLNLPCLELCLKTQATAPQASITDKTERLTHLAESFTLAPAWQKPEHQAWLQQQKILIVDDVITTGSTLSALAELLAKIGCSEIYGLAVAHGQ